MPHCSICRSISPFAWLEHLKLLSLFLTCIVPSYSTAQFSAYFKVIYEISCAFIFLPNCAAMSSSGRLLWCHLRFRFFIFFLPVVICVCMHYVSLSDGDDVYINVTMWVWTGCLFQGKTHLDVFIAPFIKKKFWLCASCPLPPVTQCPSARLNSPTIWLSLDQCTAPHTMGMTATNMSARLL